MIKKENAGVNALETVSQGHSVSTKWTPGAKRGLGILLSLLCGLTMAAQGRINGQLGVELDDSLLAAVISFGGGLILLLVVLLFSPTMRQGLRAVRRAINQGSLRFWHCLGGIGGATFVAGQSVTIAILGVAIFTVGVVAGQTISSLFVDRAGLGPAGPQPVTVIRVVSAVLTMGAVAVSLSGGLALKGAGVWLLALPLIAGVLLAVQQATNGRVGLAAGSALTAALINFVVGTALLTLAWLVSVAVRGGPVGFPSNPLLYLGGLVGVAFITLAAFVVEWTGVLLLGLSAIAGQLLGSLLLDALLPAPGRHLEPATVVGTVIALIAIVVAVVPTPWGQRRAVTKS